MTSFESTIENANRAIYGTARRRTVFFKALTGLLAFQMLFFGMAPAAWALSVPTAVSGGSANWTATTAQNGTITGNGGTTVVNWDVLSVAGGANRETLTFTGMNNAINKVGGDATIAGTLNASGVNLFIFSGGNISVPQGGVVNAASFVAAAMNAPGDTPESFWGQPHNANLVGGIVSIVGQIPGSSVLIGRTVNGDGVPSGATVVETAGGGANPMTGTFTIPSGGGTITFSGTTGDGTLKAGTINMSGSTVDNDGNVTASGDITGDFTQSGGSVSAANIQNKLTQSGGAANVSGTIATLEQTAGSANGNVTGNATVGGILNASAVGGTATINGNGAINGQGGLTVGSLMQNGGSVDANGTLTINGAASQAGGSSITANGVTLATAGANVSLNQAGNSLGTVSGTAGNVTVNGSSLAVNNLTANGVLTLQSAATASGNISANTISATTLTQGSGTITTKEITGTVVQNGGTIQANNATDGLTLSSAITTQNGTLSGNGGNISVANGSTLSGTVTANTLNGDFTQSGGTITATTVDGTVAQNGGTIRANNSTDGLTLSQAITTQRGTLSGNGGNVTLAGGDTLSGTVSAKNLSAGTGNIMQSAGTITVEETLTAGTFTQSGVSATTASAATIAANVSQTGGGTITATTAIGADGNAKTVAQSGTGLIKTDHVYGTVSQTGTGAAKLQANTSGGALVLEGDVTQNNANATIGTTSTGVTVKQGFTQTAGKIEASTLMLDNSSQTYELNGANKISTLSGSAQSVGINNGNNDLTLSSLSANADIGVTGAKDVTLDGVSSGGKVRVLSATGKVSDTSAQGAVALELGRRDAGSDVRTVGSVNLVNGTGAITIQGVNAAGNVVIANNAVTLANSGGGAESKGNIYADGDVGIQTASFTQNGKAISGANVTLDQTDATGTLTVGGDITATGDILVRSANAAEVGAANLTAGNNIVVKGKSATVAGTDGSNTANLTAKAVGVEATAGNVEIRNANFVASGGVALKASGSGTSGNLMIGDNVSMKKTAASATKDASLVVYADGDIDSAKLFGANRPSDNLTVAKGNIAFSSDSAAPTEITLNRFAYKTDSTADAFIKFSGAEIGIESKGNVNVAATRADGVTIVSGASSLGGNGAKVEAADVFATSKASVDTSNSSGNDSGNDNLAGGLIASGEDKTVTLDAAGDVTVAEGAKISSSADLNLATAAGKNFTIEAGDANTDSGIVESTAGSVSITSGGALNVAGDVKTSAKTITLKTEGDSADGITLAGDVSTYNSGNSATITLSSKTGEIEQTGGTMVGYSVNAANQTIKQTGDTARIEAITTATGITATKIEQTGGGLVAAVKIAGDFEQSGNGGTLTAYSANAITVTGKLTQNAANGIVGEVTDAGAPKQTVTLGSLDQDAGTINATTLTLRDDSTSAGTIAAGSIVVQTDGAASPDKILTQDGAGTITADSITASTVEQSHVGTASTAGAHATINADTINAALTQSGAYASASAKTAASGITITGAATQSGANATIGAAGQNATLQGGATQNSHGKVLADTLAVTGAGKTYALSSTEGNKVATLTSNDPTAQTDNPTTVASVTINNGDNALTVKDIATTGNLTVDKSGALTLGSTDNNAATADIGGTATVTDAGTVSIAGLKADSVVIAKAGAVTDTGAALSAHTANGIPAITLGQDATHQVASVLLDESAKLDVAGVQSVGDVGIQAEAITQSGAISGKNVTLDQTAGTLTVGKNVTATAGDILVRSADEVKVGDATTAPTLSAANGSIVVKGQNKVTIDNANLTAKEIGVEATKAATDTDPTAATMTLKDAKFVATGTGDGMDGVVLKSGGDLTIDAGVAAGVAAAADKDAQVTIYAGEKLNMAAGNAPAEGTKMTVTAKKLEGIKLTGGAYDDENTVTFDKFVYTEHADGQDLNFKFTGRTLSLKNLLTDGNGNVTGGGSVTVKTAGQEMSIEKTEVTGSADVLVEALDTTAATANTKESVAIEAVESGSDGIVAKDNITVDGSTGAGTVTVKGTVSSAEGIVSITSGGAIEVAAGGKVETKTANKGITLTTTGENATDITVAGATTVGNTTVAAGEVVSKGDLTMTSAKDIALAGTVSATDGKTTLTAENGKIQQTAGTLSTKDLEAKAKDIGQTGGTIESTGAASFEATGDDTLGSISLAATDNEGKAANDFATISKAVAKNAITISDKNALTIAGAAGSTDGATATTGDIDIKAVNGLTVTAAVNAGGDATLTAGAIDALAAAATITAADGKAVTATADNGATFGAKVQGGSVSLTANEGTLATGEIETKAGAATLTAGTAASGNNAAKAGTIQANSTITATGGDVIATAQGNVTLTKAVQSTDNAVTITAANGGAIDASAADATVTAADDKAVTATADNGATFGAKVQGGSVSLTANGGELNAAEIETKDGDATLTASADKLTQNGAVTVADGNAVLTGASAEIANGASVTANDGNARIASTAGTIDVYGTVEAQNVTVDATGGKVTTSAAITANGGDAYVHTTAGGIEIGANVTADGHNAVFKADADETTLGDSVVTATGVGIQGGALAEVKDANFSGVQNLALVATAGGATLTQVPASAQNVGVAVTGGDLVVETTGDTAFNGATVNAATAGEGGATVAASAATGVTAAGLTAAGTEADGTGADVTVTVTDGALAAGAITAAGATVVTANGAIKATAITGAGGTTVNANNGTAAAGGGAINVGTIGDGGNTTIYGGAVTANANGGGITGTGQVTVNAAGEVTASKITGGGGTTVNAQGQQVTVTGNLGQGGTTTVTAGSLQSGTLAAGGAATLNVGGAANVGTVDIDEDLNGNVDGLLTIASGEVGSIGQDGDGFTTDEFQLEGDLASGAVTMDAGTFQMDGNLNAVGSAVNITANGGIEGGGTLTAGALTLQGGDIGAEENPFKVNSVNLQQITGAGIYLIDTAAGQIALQVIEANGGNLVLQIPNASVNVDNGVAGRMSGNNITLTVNNQFGSLQNPVRVALGENGTLTVNGVNAPLLHIVIDGEADPGGLNIIYNADGFAIWGNDAKGYQIVGLGPEKERALNRALAFTVNTPELKSAQGIFGSPSFIHTRMNVSEARSMGNMDMLAINNTDFRGTWRSIRENADVLEEEWNPPVAATGDGPLANKIKSVKSEAEQQPELLPFARAVRE